MIAIIRHPLMYAGLALLALTGLLTDTVHAAGRLQQHDDRHTLAGAIALHDVIDQDPLEPVFWAEYRLPWRRWTLRPDGGTLVMASGGWQIWAGIRSELVPAHLPLWWAITTNIGYYRRGGGPLLGHPLEFRSGFEMYWSWSDRWSLGLTFHHLSNASVGRRNPGTEILSLSLAGNWARIRQ